MKKSIILSLVAIFMIGTCSAKSPITTHFGVVVGAGASIIDTKLPADLNLSVDGRPTWTIGGKFGIQFGKHFSLTPEVNYIRTGVKIKDNVARVRTKVNSNMVQVPILAQLKFGPVQFGVGPNFTIVDNPTYRLNGEKILFGRFYPTVTGIVNVELTLLRHLLIEARYIGSINSVMHNYTIQNDVPCRSFKIRNRAIQIRVGYKF